MLLELLTLSFIPGVGPVRLRALLLRYGNPKAAVEALADEKARELAERELQEVQEQNILLLQESDPLYPKSFSVLKNPPPLLYVKGDPELLQKESIAVVGTRAATPYGLQMAKKISCELGAASIVVVSGLARGIDTAAHLGAMESGKTVAVLGSGLLNVYPRENHGLAKKIAISGALVSSFRSTPLPIRETFPKEITSSAH